MIMAKKSTKTGSKKIQRRRKAKVVPAETTLKYALPGDGSDVYIDLFRDISRVNRRLYNQGQCVRISHIEIRQTPVDGNPSLGLEATVKALPLTWVAAQAYMKAREHWFKQQRDARAGQDKSIRPSYEDFKVYMDNGHRAGNTIATLDGAGNPVQAGEWVYSTLVYADTAAGETIREPSLHMVGPDVGTSDVGLINAYEDSRASVDGDQPNVPTSISNNIYELVQSGKDDGMSAEILSNMGFQNDSPPYEIFNYPGGALNYPTNVDKAYVQTSSANPVVSSAGFAAMLGLLRIYSQGKNAAATGVPEDPYNVTVPGIMLVHLVPGNRKGLMTANVGDLV